MPRIRTLKPEIWADEGLGRCSIGARLLFVGIITQADDVGRFRSAGALLRSTVFPYDEFTTSEVEEMLVELEREDLIRRYEARGENYGDLPGWSRHQTISHPSESRIPACDLEATCDPPEDSGGLQEPSASRESLIPSLPKLVSEEQQPRARNEQWDGLAAVFGYSPIGQSEQRHWGKLTTELRSMSATVDSIGECAGRYRTAMPSVELTPAALVKHYERLMNGREMPKSTSAAGRTLELARRAQAQENP